MSMTQGENGNDRATVGNHVSDIPEIRLEEFWSHPENGKWTKWGGEIAEDAIEGLDDYSALVKTCEIDQPGVTFEYDDVRLNPIVGENPFVVTTESGKQYATNFDYFVSLPPYDETTGQFGKEGQKAFGARVTPAYGGVVGAKEPVVVGKPWEMAASYSGGEPDPVKSIIVGSLVTFASPMEKQVDAYADEHAEPSPLPSPLVSATQLFDAVRNEMEGKPPYVPASTAAKMGGQALEF